MISEPESEDERQQVRPGGNQSGASSQGEWLHAGKLAIFCDNNEHGELPQDPADAPHDVGAGVPLLHQERGLLTPRPRQGPDKVLQDATEQRK